MRSPPLWSRGARGGAAGWPERPALSRVGVCARPLFRGVRKGVGWAFNTVSKPSVYRDQQKRQATTTAAAQEAQRSRKKKKKRSRHDDDEPRKRHRSEAAPLPSLATYAPPQLYRDQVQSTNFQQALQRFTQPPPVQKFGGHEQANYLRCGVCGADCSGEAAFKQHIASKKHRNRSCLLYTSPSPRD